MAVRRELNAFDEVSHNSRRNGDRFTRYRMESRVLFPSYRYRHSLSFPYRPRPRKPLASYTRRLALQCELCNKQMFAKTHDQSGIPVQSVPKYKKSIRQRNLAEEFSKKDFSAGFTNNCWLHLIKQTKKGLSYVSSMSFISKTIVVVIISGIIVGIFFYT